MPDHKEQPEHAFITVPEAARILRVAPRTIYRYLEIGLLKRRKLKGRTLILRQDIERIVLGTD